MSYDLDSYSSDAYDGDSWDGLSGGLPPVTVSGLRYFRTLGPEYFSVRHFSWGLTFEAGQDPLEYLEPGGHWKHLFTPAYGVTAPEVKVQRLTPSWRIASPDVARISISSSTPSVVKTLTHRYAVLLPNLGVRTDSRSARLSIHHSIQKPRGVAVARFISGGKAYATHGTARPSCGASTPELFGKVWGMYSLKKPKGIKNPSPEMILSLFS